MNDTTMAAPPRVRASAAAPAPAQRAAGRLLWQQLLEATPQLRPADAQALAVLATQRSVPAGDAVFMHRSAARELVLLLEGSVSVGHSDGAVMSPERVLHGPVWLDAASAWVEGAEHALDARALDLPVRVAELPLAAVQTLVLQRPALATGLLAVLAEQVQELSLRAHELLRKDANGRLAAWLHRHLQGAQTLLHLSERKRDIAAQLGMSPETLSRQMRQLIRLGLIEVRGYEVRVLDSAALARLAQA